MCSEVLLSHSTAKSDDNRDHITALAVRYCVNLLRFGNSQCSECYVMEGNQCRKLKREPSGTGHKIITR